MITEVLLQCIDFIIVQKGRQKAEGSLDSFLKTMAAADRT